MGDVVQGPWKKFPPNEFPPPGWRRGGMARLSDVEARRDAILTSRPRCSVCERPFARGYEHPSDICRDCRAAAREPDPPPDDPSLF